jgi:CHAT domain-containing protein/tetratricopeptide (TPR) repeat protein
MSMRDRVAIYSKSLLRSRVLQIACAGVLLFAACSGGIRNDTTTVYSTSAEVAADKQLSLSRQLDAGAYLIEVREQEIDVRVTVDAGTAHSELEDLAPRHGTVFKIVSLAAGAEIRLQARSVDHKTKRGRVDVRIARWRRAPAEPPSEAESGFVALATAGELSAVNSPTSLAGAADTLHEAFKHFEAAGDDASRATAAYALANVQYVRNDWTATVRATESAAEAYRSADDPAGLQNAATLRSAAELELASGMNAGTQRAEQQAMYVAADRRLKESAEYFGAHALPVRAAYATNLRAICALYVGNYDSSDKLFSLAAELARANLDVMEEARSLANLAYVHYRRGLVAQSAREYESLLGKIDKTAQRYQYAALLGNYGITLIALGDFDRALELHTEALDLYTNAGDLEERATELAALGSLYLRIGDTERALETLRAAIVAQRQVSDARGLASTFRLAGNAAAALGDHAQSLDYLRKSAEIDSNPHGVARTRVLIAGELRELGKVKEAENELAVPLESPIALVRANSLEERARLRVLRKDLPAAIDDLRAADRQYAALGVEFNRIDTNTALARLLLDSHDVDAAAAAADEAVSIVSRIRVKSANPEWRARFLSSRYSPFEARIAVDLASGAGDVEGAAWRAFRTAEDVRARSLNDELAFEARGGLRPIDPTEDALRARLTSQQLRLETRVQRQDSDEAGMLEIRRSIEETRALIDRNRLSKGGVTATENPLSGSLREVQQRLPAGSAVLAYFVGDDSSHAWLLSKRGLKHMTLAGRVQLQKGVDEAIAELRAPGMHAQAGQRLARMLLGSLLEGSDEKRMLVIADGPLNAVPFAALPLSASGDQPLIERFVLGYSPSLALALQAAHQPRRRATEVAVVSDPVYAPDDRRLKLASGANGGNYRGPAPPSTNQLTRLPYSALEAAAVAKSFSSADTILLSGFDASAQRVRQLASHDLAVLHFATHARARRDSPEQSALYLSEYSADGKLMPEALLTAADIAHAGLRADVVVLSGCATGDGDELRGEGVLGLTYGFLANGSNSVVASLWPIEDASTARFMSEFYRAYRVSGQAAEALRIAQLRSRESAAPAVWSSFVVRANRFP